MAMGYRIFFFAMKPSFLKKKERKRKQSPGLPIIYRKKEKKFPTQNESPHFALRPKLLHAAPFILSIIMMMIIRSSNNSPHLQFPNVQEVGFLVAKDRIISPRRNALPQPLKMRPHLRSQFPSRLPNYGQNQRIIIGQESFPPALRR